VEEYAAALASIKDERTLEYLTTSGLLLVLALETNSRLNRRKREEAHE
jgi:hypothetical protein